MKVARRPTPADVLVIATVRDAQVAVELASVIRDLEEETQEIETLLGGPPHAERLRDLRRRLRALLTPEKAA